MSIDLIIFITIIITVMGIVIWDMYNQRNNPIEQDEEE